MIGPSSGELNILRSTTTLAMDTLRSDAPSALTLLALLAHLSADDVPRRMLLAGAAELPEDSDSPVRDAIALIDATARLAELGLVGINEDALTMHRSVQAAVRRELGPLESQLWAGAAGRMVQRALPRDFGLRDWPRLIRILTNALQVIDHLEELDAEPVLVVELRVRVARLLLAQGQVDAARSHLEQALAVAERLPNQQRLRGLALNLLAVAEREFGRFTTALAHAKLARDLHQAAARPIDVAPRPDEGPAGHARHAADLTLAADVDLAEDLHNLGIIANLLGDPGQAAEHLGDAARMLAARPDGGAVPLAEVHETAFGVLVEGKEIASGLQHLRRAIEIREASPGGANSPETAILRGILLLFEGTATDQVEQARQVARTITDAYGPRHPQTATGLQLLGVFLSAAGVVDEARRMLTDGQDLHRQIYGSDNYRVATAHINLMEMEAGHGAIAAAERHLAAAVDVVLAAAAPERMAWLRLSELDRALTRLALSDAARPLRARVLPVVTARGLVDDLLSAVRSAVRLAGITAIHFQLAARRLPDAEAELTEARAALAAGDAEPQLAAGVEVASAVLAALRDDPAEVAHRLRVALDLLPGQLWWLLRYCGDLIAYVGRQPQLSEALDRLTDEERERGRMAEFRSRIVGDLPDGWFVKESVTLLAPDGQANVIASAEPLDPQITTEEYARVQGELLQKDFAGYVENRFEPIQVLGDRDGYLRAFQWTPPDNSPVVQIQIYHVAAGRGFTATATTPQAHSAAIEPVLVQALRGLRLAADTD